LIACISKGWLGLRNLRIFLKNLTKKRDDVIDKNNLKFFLINFGIVLTDKEISYIFDKHDTDKRNSINFNTFLDTLRVFFLMLDL
jgi:Ca2+-binding EF-hand superfamily protein